MTAVDVILLCLFAAAITLALTVPKFRQAAIGVAATLAAVLGARRVAAWLEPEPTKQSTKEPTKPTTFDDEDHHANEVDAADTDADPAVADAVDGVVADILRERRGDADED